ncbi:MAG: helix-turn-helix domain-containing protein [Odoribacter splanchnicus]
MQEIAYSLGFRNTSFFGKYFKRYVGISPQKYREGTEPKNERLGAAENY